MCLTRSGMSAWTEWSSILIFAATGGSVLGISMILISRQMEGADVPALQKA